MAEIGMMDLVVTAITLAIAAAVTQALWKAQKRESTQLRLVINLAMYAALAIFVAKLLELAVVMSIGDDVRQVATVQYVQLGTDIVLVLGFTFLAVSMLDLITADRQLGWRKTGADTSSSVSEASYKVGCLEPSAIPAILFRRSAPLSENTVASEFLNNAVESLLGFSQDELKSDPLFLTWLMHPEDRQQYLSGASDPAPGQRVGTFDHRFKHRNGSYRWIRTCVTRIEGHDGQLEELVGCGFDITELKEAEVQLTEILNSDPCTLLPDDVDA